MNKIILAGAVLALTLSSGAMAASSGQATTEVRTSSRGLDLTQSNGARAMLRRLDTAAVSACGASSFSVAEVKRSARRSDCYRAAMQDAVQSLAAPTVTSLYQAAPQPYAAD